MKQIAKTALALGGTLLCLSAAHSGIPNTDDPTTFLGPTLKGRYTSPLADNSAYSILGELGRKNFRLGGTVGWRLTSDQRLKLSAEWLRQDITYAFFSGNSDQWMNQWAIGAGYQYDFGGYEYRPSFDLTAYYSHAPSKTLGTRSGTFVNNVGITRTYTDIRRIAGSNAAGIAPGVSASPWIGGRVGFELNYDNVRYDKKYTSNQNATGFGGTIRLDQAVMQNVGLGLSAAIRQPFNNYTASLGWNNVPYFGGAWTLGLDAAYTTGKETLPNTWNLSLSFDYMLEPCPSPMPLNLKGDYKAETIPAPLNDGFYAWTAKPAVYMPQVLAIADERVRRGCQDGIAPFLVGTIPSQTFVAVETGTVPTAQAFSGTNLIFSVAANPIDPDNTVSINPITGVVTVNANDGDNFNVTVTATNSCGSAATTFNVTIEED